MRQPLPDIQFWRDVPAMEACVRRTYKSLTSGRNSPDMYLLKSVEGVCYITGLFEQLKLYFEQVEKLVAGSPPYMAKTLVVLRYCLVVCSPPILHPEPNLADVLEEYTGY